MIYYVVKSDKMSDVTILNRPDLFFNQMVGYSNLLDDTVKSIIKDIDKSEVLSNNAVSSPVLGIISPERLSTGCKSLCSICLKEKDEYLQNKKVAYRATLMGDNCGEWFLRLGQKYDIYWILDRRFSFEDNLYKKYPNVLFCLDTESYINSDVELASTYYNGIQETYIKWNEENKNLYDEIAMFNFHLFHRASKIEYSIPISSKINVLIGDSGIGKSELLTELNEHIQLGIISNYVLESNNYKVIISPTINDILTNIKDKSILFFDEMDEVINLFFLDNTREISKGDMNSLLRIIKEKNIILVFISRGVPKQSTLLQCSISNLGLKHEFIQKYKK